MSYKTKFAAALLAGSLSIPVAAQASEPNFKRLDLYSARAQKHLSVCANKNGQIRPNTLINEECQDLIEDINITVAKIARKRYLMPFWDAVEIQRKCIDQTLLNKNKIAEVMGATLAEAQQNLNSQCAVSLYKGLTEQQRQEMAPLFKYSFWTAQCGRGRIDACQNLEDTMKELRTLSL